LIVSWVKITQIKRLIRPIRMAAMASLILTPDSVVLRWDGRLGVGPGPINFLTAPREHPNRYRAGEFVGRNRKWDATSSKRRGFLRVS
jgi:hypothetical protein